MENEGLREKKKRSTRRSIADVASTLFFERGFDNVTIAEVAEAAEVSKKTVTNYFPRKEDLLLDRQEDRLVEIEAHIRGRAPGESVLTVMRRYQHELLATGHPMSGAIEHIASFVAVVQASPALTNRWREMGTEVQDKLAEILTDEIADNARARLVGVTLGAAMVTISAIATERMLRGDKLEDVRRDQVGVIDTAFDLLETGIGDYGAKP
jgi:AcrR family transcriptional regulator